MNKLRVLIKAIKWLLNRPPELIKGQSWYVKLPSHEQLQSVIVLEVYSKSVALHRTNRCTNSEHDRITFKISDVEFVDRND